MTVWVSWMLLKKDHVYPKRPYFQMLEYSQDQRDRLEWLI